VSFEVGCQKMSMWKMNEAKGKKKQWKKEEKGTITGKHVVDGL
jgi:hypothetical protein